MLSASVTRFAVEIDVIAHMEWPDSGQNCRFQPVFDLQAHLQRRTTKKCQWIVTADCNDHGGTTFHDGSTLAADPSGLETYVLPITVENPKTKKKVTEIVVLSANTIDLGASGLDAMEISFSWGPGKKQTQGALAKKLGVDHFNFYQTIEITTEVKGGWTLLDGGGNVLKKKFVDPPPDGLIIKKKGKPITDFWADKHPWYLDENVPPKEKMHKYNENFALRTKEVLQRNDTGGRRGRCRVPQNGRYAEATVRRKSHCPHLDCWC